jgi:WXG100 family type VII secretion target
VITLDYAALGDLQGRMRHIYQDIETNLSDLKQQVETVSKVWTGAASDGFQGSVRTWLQSAADLQERLAELHNFVGRAHDNQASAVASNTRIWSAGARR